MDHLDYQSVLSCAATSNMFLNDAMPLITTLNIDHSVEMSAVLTTRYRDVRNINLFSLLKGRILDDWTGDEDNDDPIELLSVDYDSVLQVIPFLSRFPNLQKVFFGGRKIDGSIVSFCHWEDLLDEDEDPGRVQSLIDMVSGSYKCGGGLLSNVQVRGLRCPGGSDFCEVCERACRCFPLDQVITFDSEGSSESDESAFSSKKMHCLDACLSMSELLNLVRGEMLFFDPMRAFFIYWEGEVVMRYDPRMGHPYTLYDTVTQRRKNSKE